MKPQLNQTQYYYNYYSNEQYHQFILSYFNENEQQDNINLDKAIVSLTLFLRERGFLINEKRNGIQSIN